MATRRIEPEQAKWPDESALIEPDYADAFHASAADATGRPAEAWMRLALEGAPVALRLFVQIGWRYVLGLRPAPAPAILGWAIVDSADDWVVLEQRSRLLSAQLLLRRMPSGLTWGTRICYRWRGTAALWAVVGVLHRRIVPIVLTRAARS